MKERKGLVHIYHGDGKGKTTCGMGLCVRAAGAGLKVLIFQFLKKNDSNELKILEQIPIITIVKGLDDTKFLFQMSEEEKEKTKKFYQDTFDQVLKMAVEDDYDLLFLDESIHAVNNKMIEEEKLLDFLKNRPEKLEVVLNGYYPSDALREAADYISHIQKEKHPFDKGIGERTGIEK